ncbi:MAG: glycoside hydrolase family 5 protein [Prevotella sp.]|jgi:hypothetical protein|nr:glycoside hydrolase family 5 protein [Prevotella sp.]
MKKNLFYIVISFCLAMFQAMAQNLPEQGKIPVVAWHGIPMEKSADIFPMMKNAGIDIYLAKYKDVATTLKILDIAQAAGVKLITSCPELKSDVETTVKRLMHHPALYGYYLKDEPETWDLPELGVWVRLIQAIDKTNPCYINLYPNWAWGKERYAANLQSFIEQVPVPFVSFDNYPIVEINDAPSILRPDWYRNLEEISDAAKKAKLPFWAFALAWSHDLDSIHHYAVPTLAELRLQVFSDLAYGAQAIQYFTFYGAMDENGKTPVYDLLQTVNREVQNLSGVFLGATAVSVWHTGSHIPDGTRQVGKLPEAIKSLTTSGRAVVSLLEKENNQYLVIVNCDYRNAMALSIDVDASVQRVLKDGTVAPVNKSTEQIEGGDMIIYTWKNERSTVREVWTKEQANEWYKQWGWFRGCNFIPSTAVNQLEMWQAETFDPATIDKELGWAEDIGMNCMRVYLHHVAWETDKAGFKKRMNAYLDIAGKHHISTIFVIFDDCWNPIYKAGKQPEPQPGVHNSGWLRDPGDLYYKGDTAKILPVLEAYVKDILTAFKDDKRIILWDLYNEPGGSNPYGMIGENSLPLLQKAFTWSRAVNPSQPLSAGVWTSQFPNLNNYQLENSDVITYHTYEPFDSHRQAIDTLEMYGRPMICTEYMARTRNSTFEAIMPLLKAENIGAINWGLVSGKTNTIFAWDTPMPDIAEPPVWFHDIFRKDGTPYSQEEIDVIKSLTLGK